MPLITEITIFVLAAFVGFEVISKVPTTLHTPLMSQTNAIHGIVLLGGLIVVGLSNFWLDNLIGTIAIIFGTINIVGGFMVTDRMLGMFVRKPQKKPDASSASRPGASGSDEGRAKESSGESDESEDK
jgi:NAD(P) transhydrogenase subunit alpha